MEWSVDPDTLVSINEELRSVSGRRPGLLRLDELLQTVHESEALKKRKIQGEYYAGEVLRSKQPLVFRWFTLRSSSDNC